MFFSKKMEQCRKMYIVAMEIMQMHDIWIDFLDSFTSLYGSNLGMKTLTTIQPPKHCMHFVIQFASDSNKPRWIICADTLNRPHHKRVMTFCKQACMNILNNMSGASNPIYGVNLQYLHFVPLNIVCTSSVFFLMQE